MQFTVLSCLLGVACAMGLWAAVSAQTTVDDLMRRHGKAGPPDKS